MIHLDFQDNRIQPAFMSMTMDEYQWHAKQTADYPLVEQSDGARLPVYPALGLAGEAGEVVEKIKKAWRNRTQLNIEDITKELGDVMWYVAVMADELGITLGEVADANVAKLASRKERDVIKSEGDNR